MIRALIDGFRRYVDFRGRTGRAGFWNFVIATHLVIILLMVPAYVEFLHFFRFAMEDVRVQDMMVQVAEQTAPVESLLPVMNELADEYLAHAGNLLLPLVGLLLSVLLALVCLVPTIAITVRRLRDAGQSVWWVLAPIGSMLPVPFLSTCCVILSLAVLVLCCLPTRADAALPEIP